MTNNDVDRHWKDFQNGDDRAFKFIVKYFQKRIFYYLLGRVGDKDNAEELTSKLWVRLINNKSKDIRNLNAYIFKIAKNLIKDEYKLRDNKPEFESTDNITVKLDSTAVYLYDYQDLQEELKKIFTPQEYEICQLVVEGYDYKEIADRIELSSSTVANKLTAIRQKLKQLFTRNRKG